MRLSVLDWWIVIGSLIVSVAIGIFGGRRAGRSANEFFLSGRTMPGWLLGVSMVATTFSTDTPNLVTGLTRTHGVAGNWLWWAFLLTSMATAFCFAPLWRRSGVTTDMEFYELRYSGRPAAFLRAFRGVYVGILINILIMGAVTLAAVKFGSILFGFSPMQCVLVAGSATVAFSVIGGLRGILLSDLFLFVLAMIGAIAAAVVAANHPQVGGLTALFAHPNVREHSAFLPNLSNPDALVSLLLLPLLVQWWSVWYPGAEPGGGGFVAQRMLAAKDERNSVTAMLMFNVAHYALRPWPWIIVALASLIVFPSLESLRDAFPEVDPAVVNQDLAYAAMLTFLPHGLLGIMVASLIAAYISTIATCLNLGAAYVVNDLYRRFWRPRATDRELVLIGRIATVLLMICAAVVGLALDSAMQAFNVLLSIGAGTGLLFMVRWYWPRISAWSEITAMVISLFASLSIQLTSLAAAPEWAKLTCAVAVTTIGWIAVTLLTPPTSADVMREFYTRVRPPGRAWRKLAVEMGWPCAGCEVSQPGVAVTCIAAGCGFVYAMLFAAGALLRDELAFCAGLCVLALASAAVCWKMWPRLGVARETQEPTSSPGAAALQPEQ